MIQKKVCMLGDFAVGKTSLVRRFVRSIFSEKYHSTVGVTIDRKQVEAGGREINMVLWDLAGDDIFQSLQLTYLRGSSGYLFVADGTRRDTLDKAVQLQRTAAREYGPVPFVLVLNKADLVSSWDLDEATLDELRRGGWDVLRTSALSGAGVEEAFLLLAAKLAAAPAARDEDADEAPGGGGRP